MEEFENQAVNALALQDITAVQVFAELSVMWEGVGDDDKAATISASGCYCGMIAKCLYPGGPHRT